MFKKLFCNHQWKTHASREVKQEKELTNGAKQSREITREILICTVCGKIKIIEY
jgi:hypothetical protein